MTTPLEARLDSISLAARCFAHDLGNLMLPQADAFTQIASVPGLTDRQRRLCGMVSPVVEEMSTLRDLLENVIDRPREVPEAGLDLATWWRGSVRIIRPLIPGRPALRSQFEDGVPRVAVAGPTLGRALLATLLDAADHSGLADELALVARPDARGAGGAELRISGLDGERGDGEGVSLADRLLGAVGGGCSMAENELCFILPKHEP